SHQHAADGAVAADELLHACVKPGVDHVTVDRVQHDDGGVLHAQRRGRIDPQTVPAGCAQLGVDLFGVVPALSGDDDGQFGQRVDVVGVLQCGLLRFDAVEGGGGPTGVGGGEEHRVDVGEVALSQHAVDQYRPHHAAPADHPDRGGLGGVGGQCRSI